MTVVREDDNGHAGGQACEERNAVVSIHHHVNATHIARAEQQRQQRTRVDAELGASARIEHTVAALAFGRIHVASGAKDHLVPLGRQVFAHALKVALGSAALRVGGIAPTE